MENHTFVTEFYILAFSTVHTQILFFVFLLLYLIGILMNMSIITVICHNKHLHNPMYFFLCNLAIIDGFFTTTTAPSLLYMLSTGNHRVSLITCFTQIYFFIMACSTENILLVAMAYDRYVAICIPLHYHSILNSRNCTILNIVIWILGGLNSAMFTAPATKMSFCLFNVIEQYFCEANALGKIACAGREDFQATAYFDLFLMGFCPFFGCLTSYTRIINVILSIHSKDGRIKAFSTCSSHIIVIFIYFGSGALDYLQSLSKSSHFQAQAITVLYANVTPMVNPIIYSLRNEELKQALKKLLGQLLRIFIK